MTVRILLGDCRDVLKTLPDESVDCCVSSPPYWLLRSYLPEGHPNKAKEIGSEPTLQQWVDTMVEVFRDVRRVLRPKGTLWLNLGDAYAGSRRGGNSDAITGEGKDRSMVQRARRDNEPIPRSDVAVPGLKPKDMMGQPWRVAFALQADGWWLRQEIIWNKPNPMPESTRDRCTKAHEHVFLLSKSERYFYDFEAMQEPVSGTANARRSIKTPDGWDTSKGEGGHGTVHKAGREKGKYQNNGVGFGHGFDENPKPRVTDAAVRPTTRASHNMGREPGWRSNGVTPKAELGAETGYAEGKAARMAEGGVGDLVDTRNPRSVWTIPTHGFKGAHFATFPPELAARCITAGCPEGGTVLDPFGGSGTVGLVADRQHKHAVLIDLDERNLPMAQDRITADSSLFAQVET